MSFLGAAVSGSSLAENCHPPREDVSFAVFLVAHQNRPILPFDMLLCRPSLSDATGFCDVEDEHSARLQYLVDSAEELPEPTLGGAGVEQIIHTLADRGDGPATRQLVLEQRTLHKPRSWRAPAGDLQHGNGDVYSQNVIASAKQCLRPDACPATKVNYESVSDVIFAQNSEQARCGAADEVREADVVDVGKIFAV